MVSTASAPPMMDRPIGRRSPLFMVLTAVAIAYPAFFLLANATLHLLRRDLDPATHYISEYAVGRFGLLMSIALVLLGIGTIALAAGMNASLERTILARIGTGVLAVSGIGTILTGLFRTDIDGAGRTIAGAIHGRAALGAIVLEALAVLLLTGASFQDTRWHVFRRVSFAFSVAVVVSIALYPFIPHGTGERLLVYTLVLWLFVAALRMRDLGERGGRSPERR